MCVNKLPKARKNYPKELQKIMPRDHTGQKIVPAPTSQSEIPHNSCGINQSPKRGLASVTWKKIYSRLNCALVLPKKAQTKTQGDQTDPK